MIGNYHNGPLTVLLTFGLGGMIAFLWFSAAAVRVLYRNYVHAPPHLRTINTFLLSYFLMRLLYFLVFYGQIAEDFYLFTGLVGLSIALNNGIQPKPQVRLAESSVPTVMPAEPVPALA